jgi:indole-3-glycerol phosphate synthase
MGFLTETVERVRRELRDHPLPEGSLLLRTGSLPPPIDLEGSLRSRAMSIVAEVKRASPSAGAIAETDAGEQAARYQAGGAAAISVLTEPHVFDGSLADLRSVRRRTALPVLRKDFLVHPAQIIQSRAEGADAVLLIAAALSGAELDELRTVASELGLSALVEAHSQGDLDRALASGAPIIGVNARDLEALDVDLDRALDLAAAVPEDRVLVIESGIASRQHVELAKAAGARAVLVGEALMRSADPAALIRELSGDAAVAPLDGARRP